MKTEQEILNEFQKELESASKSVALYGNVATSLQSGTLGGGGNIANFNYFETLRIIDLYFNSKFEYGDKDSEGFKKYFFNIVKFPCRVAAKAIDLDTKDLRAVSEDGKSYWASWFLMKELKHWLKKEYFGETINQIGDLLPRFGSVVLKAIKGEPYIVSLFNLYLADQSVEKMSDTNFMEAHYYLPWKFKIEGEKRGWGHLDEVISNYKSSDTNYVSVFERYGVLKQKDFIEDGDDKFVLTMTLATGLDLPVYDPRTRKIQGYKAKIIFGPVEIKEIPYKEVHWEKIGGRWLGRGMVEDLIENQMRENQLAYQKAKSFAWTSKRIYQTSDTIIERNLLTDVQNGDIVRITPGSQGIVPIVNEERNMKAYAEEERKWDDNTQKMSFSFESASGETLPSGTPFRLGALMTNAVAGFFEKKRENFGMFLKEILFDLVIPSFKKQHSRDHVFNLLSGEDEIEKFATFSAEMMVHKEAMNHLKQTGFLPDNMKEEIERVKQEMLSRHSIETDIPGDFYDDIKYRLDFAITGEETDRSKIETFANVIQLLSSDPTILQDPNKRKVFFRLMESVGVNPEEMFFEIKTPIQPATGALTPTTPQLTPTTP